MTQGAGIAAGPVPLDRPVAITGAGGLLGRHLAFYAHALGIHDVRKLDRSSFDSGDAMNAALRGAGVVVHCAARLRGNDDEVIGENCDITRRLVEGLDRTGALPHVLFASSIKADRDDAHGRSKRETDDVLRAWCAERGARYTCLELPHIFGEGGRPNHNSVISTFCAQVATGATPSIANDGEIEPLHAQRAAEKIFALAFDGAEEERRVRLHGRPMRVSAFRDLLVDQAASYDAHVVPDLRDDFALDLFNTYRSYLFPARYPVSLTRHTDPRGSLVELVRERNGGQVFYSVTKPGVTRGNHFHRRKVERFVVLSGTAEIALRRIDGTERIVFAVSGESAAYIDMPTFYTHNITNTGSDDLVTLFWTHELFDPANPDTHADPV